MNRALPLLLLAAVGCPPWLREPDDAPPAETDTPEDTGEIDLGPACDGTWSLTLDAVPATQGRQPFSWEDAGVVLRVEPEAGSLVSGRDENGCLRLSPGVLRLDLVPSRCGARAVRVDVVDTCGPACTTLEILDDFGKRAAYDRNATTDTAERLELVPAAPFFGIVVRSLDASICGVSFDQAPLPERLQPVDTGALF